MADRSVHTDKAPKPVGLYPHARKVGNLLFVSGIGPRTAGTDEIPGLEQDAEGNIVKYDIEAETRSVFHNIKVILEEAGTSWENIVDVTVFLTNMKDDFQQFNAVYAEHFQTNQPTRTTVEVGSLPTPIAVELKCIATIE